MATKNTVLRRSPRSKSAVIIRRLRAYRFHRPQSPKVMFDKLKCSKIFQLRVCVNWRATVRGEVEF